ncbi:MAG: hypothetical protein RBT49_03995 [Bacteroidales bacterium]|jgi:hypothetical protein|nr:hypothetical protein [Bacteroidales bacterium]
MRKESIRFYALAIVFIAVTVVFYSQIELSLARYLIFIMGGFAAGVLVTRGIFASKPKEE